VGHFWRRLVTAERLEHFRSLREPMWGGIVSRAGFSNLLRARLKTARSLQSCPTPKFMKSPKMV
jgi:hypothetical protein